MSTLRELTFTGERYVPGLMGQIRYEHVHRYAIARRLAAGRRVLDVASGEGYGTALLATTAAQAVGVDIDESSVERARSVYYASNLRFVVGSASALPLADAGFDFVSSFETLEHIAEHERMVDEIKRVLAPGGTLVISTPNKRVYSDIPQYSNPFHVRELYFSEFRELLSARFRHVRIYGQRIAAASVVHPLANAVVERPIWFAGRGDDVLDALPALIDPTYFLAVASDEPIEDLVESAFLDPSDDVFGATAREMQALRNMVERLDGTLPGELSAGRAALTSTNTSRNDLRAELDAVHEAFRVADAERLHNANRYDELAELYNRERAERERDAYNLRERLDESDRKIRSLEEDARDAHAAFEKADALRIYQESRYEELEALYKSDGSEKLQQVTSLQARVLELEASLSEAEHSRAALEVERGEIQREMLGWADRARIVERELAQTIEQHAREVSVREAGYTQALSEQILRGSEQLGRARAERDALQNRAAVLQDDADQARAALESERERWAQMERELRSLADAAHEALQSVVDSKSWRLTRPLRLLARRFGADDR
ncbi:methyltransferase domain-containing protein [Vulcanimicrobium alpinum]|nr:methyltransferase domain-containing protein [Vulcanimicrobium alpinum]